MNGPVFLRHHVCADRQRVRMCHRFRRPTHPCLVTQLRYWSVPGTCDPQWYDIHVPDTSVYPPRFTRSGPSRTLDRFRFPISCRWRLLGCSTTACHDQSSPSSCQPVTEPTAWPHERILVTAQHHVPSAKRQCAEAQYSENGPIL